MSAALPRCVAVILALAFAGCAAKPTGLRPVDTGNPEVKEDALGQLPDRLRKEGTPDALRGVLQQIDAQTGDDRDACTVLSADALAALRADFRLNDAEVTELKRVEFSGLDAQYLAECLLFRDAVRAIEADKYPKADQPGIVFAWVTRQIWPKDREMPPAPPGFVARRGSGDGLERAYVFLAALQQLGIDACLIGPADAGDKLTFTQVPGAAQPSPFTAVGALVDGKVQVFDPWKGEPLKAMPEGAKAFVVAPLSGLSPRLCVVEKRLAESQGVKLLAKPAATRKAFAAALGAEPAVWNPPGDIGAYPRVLASFLPHAEGGLIVTKPDEFSRLQAFQLDVVPWGMFPPAFRSANLDGVREIQQAIAGLFVSFILKPGSDHEKLIRGQFNEVTRSLSQVREDALRAKESADREAGLEAAVAEWLRDAKVVYADLSRAQRRNDPVALADAQAKLFEFRKYKSAKFDAYVGKIGAEQLLLEATYLIALCKHELAERQQSRLDHAKEPNPAEAKAAHETWATAAEWWDQFRLQHTRAEELFPARFEQARKLHARAEAKAVGK